MPIAAEIARREDGVGPALESRAQNQQVDAGDDAAAAAAVVEAHRTGVLALNGSGPLPADGGRRITLRARCATMVSGLDDWLQTSASARAKIDDVLDACAVAIAARDACHCSPAGRARKTHAAEDADLVLKLGNSPRRRDESTRHAYFIGEICHQKRQGQPFQVMSWNRWRFSGWPHAINARILIIS